MQRTFRLQLQLFFYSTANITGCALALLGPLLLLVGLIGPGWWAITAGLYAAGWLLGRREPALERHIEADLTAEQILDQLDHLIAQARPSLTADMQSHLASIREATAAVLPRLLNSHVPDDDLYTVRETVLNYLPATLANYVALPPAFRASHVLQDGKTARQLMAEQLALLDAQLGEVVANVASADAQALLANGQFLRARFQQPDFRV